MGLIENGLIAAIIVAIAANLIIIILSDRIFAKIKANPLPQDAGKVWRALAPDSKWRVCAIGMGFWTLMSFIIGIIGIYVYDYVASNWNSGGVHFLILALILAVIFSSIAFKKGPDGKRMPFVTEWVMENFTMAVGFGILIPWLTG